nr:MAG TPA: hypothetical protein [Crassvirales sp.]
MASPAERIPYIDLNISRCFSSSFIQSSIALA